MKCLTNPITQPSFETYLIWITLTSSEVIILWVGPVISDSIFMGICLILGSRLNSWPADEISWEQIQAEDETVQSENHNSINSFWSKEDSSD
jgi:hypothetical protein